jgi:GTPase Era involved in 16S rRNA processing
VTAHLPEREFAFDPEDLGTQPTRFFATEYLREAAFLHLEDELPYAFAAEIEEFPRSDRSGVHSGVAVRRARDPENAS